MRRCANEGTRHFEARLGLCAEGRLKQSFGNVQVIQDAEETLIRLR